jgi:NosR/NirI family nitrous oxide reductase transcriptional regulator
MRVFATAVVFVVGAILVGAGQGATDSLLQTNLKRVFPTALSFSAKGGEPPHFTAYLADPRTGPQALGGYVFWTTDVEPLERGYDGPIKMLVGLDTKGVITGVIVVEDHEPFGPISVRKPQFAAQFKGKKITDPFKVGADVDAVSSASITITSATRSIKNGSRRIARQLLTPP